MTTRDGIELTEGMKFFVVQNPTRTTTGCCRRMAGTIVNDPVWGLRPRWDNGNMGAWPSPYESAIYFDEGAAIRHCDEWEARAKLARIELDQAKQKKCARDKRRRTDWDNILSEAMATAVNGGDDEDIEWVEHYLQSVGPTSTGFRAAREFIKTRSGR